MEDEPIIVNRALNLTSSSAANFVEVYSPGSGFNGYVSDFLATVQITSIPQLPQLEPGDPYETTAQRDYRYYELVKNHTAKYLGIYISLPGSEEKILRSRIKIWNSWPPYQQDLLGYLTTAENLVLAAGSKLWVKIEDEVPGGSILWAGDVVNLWLVASELPVANYAIASSTARSVTVSTTSAVVVPANTNRKLVTIVNRGASICYLNFGSTALPNAGISLNPGGSSYTLNVREINYKGAISAIVASGTAVLEIMEAV